MNGTSDEHFLQRRALLAATAASGAAALWPALAALGPAPSAPVATPPPADLDALLQAAMSGRAVPAMAALAIRGGEAGALVCRGQRSVDGPDPVRAGDAWHIGSCSKAMTATVIARLVERGSLAWSTTLDTLLPNLAEGMRPAYREVTLVDLLSHRAGLPENPPIERVLAYFDDSGRPSTGPRSGNPAVLAPAGDVHVSLEDWSVFVIDQMRGESGEGRLLQPPTDRLLHAPVPGTRLALGWGVRNGTPETLTHTGSDGAWFAAVAMVPSRDNAVLVAANAAADAGGDTAVLQVLKGLLPTLVKG